MEEYLNTGIKEVISKFPPIADLLNRYNIGCVTCNPGTCLLKDVVGIHALAPEEEAELMAGIARIIRGDAEAGLPGTGQENKLQTGEAGYSPPWKANREYRKTRRISAKKV